MSLPDDASHSKEEEHEVSELNIDAEMIMESIVRVSFAGLGGSLVGLGQKRRLETMRVLTGAAATAAARRRRSPMTSQLNMPWTMALSCMAFCGVVETCRLTSPSSIVLQSLESRKMEPFGKSEASRSAAITISDFTIGGAVAGIAGSFGKTSQKRIPVAALRGSGRFFGFGPGLALGMIAGAFQAAADYSINYLEMTAALEKETLAKPQVSEENVH
ncbi:unnamed protein product [Cylindrotheca closterium]|uniref:Uncharacterized protein n=1 Tax=Cylindrotheca closterium TaxID=2856 RepID=A0AAD2CGT6_9STRA|nr:unnamed protein product [Cylindrotheca closterium]